MRRITLGVALIVAYTAGTLGQQQGAERVLVRLQGDLAARQAIDRCGGPGGQDEPVMSLGIVTFRKPSLGRT